MFLKPITIHYSPFTFSLQLSGKRFQGGNMEEMTVQEKDTRKLLKTFGVRVDQAIQQHLRDHPELDRLRVKFVLVDLTAPAETGLHLEVEGEIQRG
jgi:hypothetical protein